MRAPYLVVLAIAGLIGTATPAAAQRGRGPAPGSEFGPRTPALTEVAPDIDMMDSKGNTVRITDARGKFLVVEHWLPGEAIIEAKAAPMNALRSKYADNKDVEFYVVVGTGKIEQDGQMERTERRGERYGAGDLDTWKKTIAAIEPNLKNARVLTEGDLAVGRLMYGNYANETYLLDKQGKVISRWTWNDPVALEAALDKATGTGSDNRAVVFTGKVRPDVPPAVRAAQGRNRAQALPLARDLVSLGVEPFIKKYDKNDDGELSATEAKFPADMFKRMDRDDSGSLSGEELEPAREAAEQRLAKK